MTIYVAFWSTDIQDGCHSSISDWGVKSLTYYATSFSSIFPPMKKAGSTAYGIIWFYEGARTMTHMTLSSLMQVWLKKKNFRIYVIAGSGVSQLNVNLYNIPLPCYSLYSINLFARTMKGWLWAWERGDCKYLQHLDERYGQIQVD